MTYEQKLQECIDLVSQHFSQSDVDCMTSSQMHWHYARLVAQGHPVKPVQIKNPFKYLTPENTDDLLKYNKNVSVVYFFYDVNMVLLYVGRTINFVTRWKDHWYSNKDMKRIDSVCLHVFETRQEMLYYEIQKINELKPLWNVSDTQGSVSRYEMQPAEVNWFSCNSDE